MTFRGKMMRSVYIRFTSKEDRTRGFYALAKNARISSLPGEIYQVPRESLDLLDAERVSYRRATDAEVEAAHGQIRNPSPTVLQ
jgi:hypothetical protein